MRKIEMEMRTAIQMGRDWKKDNTEVRVDSHTHGKAFVFLHGNHIATVPFCMGMMGEPWVNLKVLERWPTPTTKSRLRALGVSVYTKNWVTYVNGQPV